MPNQLKKVGSATRATRTRAPKPTGRESVSRTPKGFERVTGTSGVAARKRTAKRPVRRRSQ